MAGDAGRAAAARVRGTRSLGDLDAVRGYFDDAGRPKGDLGRNVDRMGSRGPALARAQRVDYALLYAAGHDRRPVVEFLLTKDPDLTVRDPVFDATALGFARYVGNSDVVTLLGG